MDATEASAPTQPRITTAVYAHVHAAVAEDLPLGDVLAHEGVTKDRWEKAEIQNRRTFATDKAAFAAYEQALVAAEDRLGRAVAPIDQQPAGWLAFLDAYGRAPAPFSFLLGLGLRLTDVARLRRVWNKRAAEDDKLEERFAELRKAKLPPLPALTIGPTPFVSSAGVPFVKKRRAGADDASMEAMEIEGLGIDRLASLAAEIAAWPRELDRIRARYGLDRAAHDTLLARFREAFAEDATLERDYRRLYAHHEHRLRSAVAPADGGARAPSPPGAPAGDAQALARALGARLASQGLTFKGTALASAPSGGAALPFQPASAAPAIAQPTSPSDKPKRPSLSETVAVVEFPPDATPFGGEAPRTAESVISRAARAAAATREEASASPPATPVASRPPQLTLEQHASLCVELSLAPERTADVLTKYGLTNEQKVALDGSYERMFTATPEARARWNTAFDSYRTWLTAKR